MGFKSYDVATHDEETRIPHGPYMLAGAFLGSWAANHYPLILNSLQS